jgi:hypothetical protein
VKIIVITCDRYTDVAPTWLYLWREHWPDCPYDARFLTNKKKLSVDIPVTYIVGEDIKLGWRLRTFIREHYTDEHILITMADYLPKSFDVNLIAKAHELCALPDVRHVRLRPMPKPPYPYPVDGFGRINKGVRYSLSLQPGIWEAQTLYDLLDDRWNPWQCEVLGSLKVRNIEGEFLSVNRLAMPFMHYYRKGRPDGLRWVQDNVAKEAWPEAVKDAAY